MLTFLVCDLKYWRADEFFPELGKDFDKVNEYTTVEMVHMNELKKDYPDKAEKIHQRRNLF